jgi:RNA polymerase sigma-70 factor (ECF subfamily)
VATLADAEIARGYLEGSADAIRTVDRWIQAVIRSRHWGLGEERDDILQDTRKRVFENLVRSQFRGDSSLKTYVIQIAKHVCIEFLRRKIRVQADDIEGLDVEDEGPSPELQLEAKERERLLSEALGRMPAPCRELFEMIFRDRLAYEEIARRLGVAPGTVKSRAARCRAFLSKCLKQKHLEKSEIAGNRQAQGSTL